ncbi:MAG: polysaccharide deacetylase family protein [Kiritimatiellae bacterium]|jgi:hypothetical protein|nr:polysaccharide deacetylase family protein [Kiritimatiellia bacterium]
MDWKVFILLNLLVSPCLADPIDVSTTPPGGLDPDEVPQLILITFDDSTNNGMFDNVQKISGHTNPDGSPVGFTFFVSLDSPDFYNTHKLHAAGHEIAVHTVTHTTSKTTTAEDWAREIAGCRQALIRYSQIPAEDIRGFRSPFLAYNSDTFRVLHDMGFDYDCSVPETVPGLITRLYDAFIWPYHLHDGLKQNPWTGTPPDRPLPNLMEVPMWNLRTFNGTGYHTMDPGEGSRQDLLNMFKENFTTRYDGNRIPLGVWLHSGWASSDDNVGALNDFLEWALIEDDVWVVPVSKLVDWMHTPLPVGDLDLPDLLTVEAYDPIPESETFYNNFPPTAFRTVGHRAHSFPNPANLMYEVHEDKIPLNFEFEVINTWNNNFTANVVVSNPADEAVSDWSATLTTPNATLSNLWNSAFTSSPGGGSLEPVPWTTPIPAHANQHIVATFNSTGSADGLTIQGEGVLIRRTPTPPKLEVRSEEGKFFWQNRAPIYELQGREALHEGSWNTIQTFYGTTETTLPDNSPYLFFRLKAVH